MQSVFTFHDRSRFEIFVYSLRPSDDSVHRKQIEADAEHFFEVSHLDFVTIASRIAQDGIHVLVNLNGYTKGARNEIFALRPAAIQMLYMGFPGTMGADFLDYLVTDASSRRLTSSGPTTRSCSACRTPTLSTTTASRSTAPTAASCRRRPSRAIGSARLRRRQAMATGARAADAMDADADAATTPPQMGAAAPKGSSRSTPATSPSERACEHPPLASYEWYQANGYGHMLGVREALRARYGLPPFALLFCCFNQLYKLDPTTFACKAWCAHPARGAQLGALAAPLPRPRGAPHQRGARRGGARRRAHRLDGRRREGAVHCARLPRGHLPRHAALQRPHDRHRHPLGGRPHADVHARVDVLARRRVALPRARLPRDGRRQYGRVRTDRHPSWQRARGLLSLRRKLWPTPYHAALRHAAVGRARPHRRSAGRRPDRRGSRRR